jgi:hypothetical protein
LYVLLLSGEGVNDTRQKVIHIYRFELQFPLEVALAEFTFVTKILAVP